MVTVNTHRTETDMLGSARQAQWTPDTFLGPGSTKLIAPAKVNLFLGIQGRRDDGFHNVVNIMHSISLHDILYLQTEPLVNSDDIFDLAEAGTRVDVAIGGPNDNLAVKIDLVNCEGTERLTIPARENIVFKAADALARVVGYDQYEHIVIHLEKHIPHQGGLGGGSSDAAAVLVGLADRWSVDPRDPRLVDVGSGLGSDVVFFMRGGCSLLNDTGGQFIHALEPAKDSIVLVKPAGGVSTQEAYRMFDKCPLPIPADQLRGACDAVRASAVPLFNNLAPAAMSLKPELADIARWMAAQSGVRDVLLCGSGATTFARMESFSHACELATAAQRQGFWVRVTSLSSIRASVMGGSS